MTIIGYGRSRIFPLLLPLCLTACNSERADAQENVQAHQEPTTSARPASAPPAPGQPRSSLISIPENASPHAPLMVGTRNGSTQATHRPVSSLLCPLLADGWKLTVLEAPVAMSGEDKWRNIIYTFKRDDEEIKVYAVRHWATGKPPIMVLDNLVVGGAFYSYERAWPVLNEIFAQEFPECQ